MISIGHPKRVSLVPLLCVLDNSRHRKRVTPRIHVYRAETTQHPVQVLCCKSDFREIVVIHTLEVSFWIVCIVDCFAVREASRIRDMISCDIAAPALVNRLNLALFIVSTCVPVKVCFCV